MELLDIFDEDMNKIGVEERKVVHEKGLWHIHVGVWMMNQEGKILLQKRSSTKNPNPNKWTRTGGHVESGETPLIGIQREVEEEVGVKIPENKFELISVEKEEANETNRNFIYSYFSYVDYKIEDYTMQKEEVGELKYITIEEVENAQKENDKNYTFINWNKEKFNQTILILKQKRDKMSH